MVFGLVTSSCTAKPIRSSAGGGTPPSAMHTIPGATRGQSARATRSGPGCVDSPTSATTIFGGVGGAGPAPGPARPGSCAQATTKTTTTGITRTGPMASDHSPAGPDAGSPALPLHPASNPPRALEIRRRYVGTLTYTP